MTKSSISNPPTSFPTEEMKLEGVEFWHKCADKMLLDDLVSGIYLAMHKASPQLQSTEVVERVAMALFEHEWSTTFNSPPKWGFDGSEAYWKEAARAAITSLTSPAPACPECGWPNGHDWQCKHSAYKTSPAVVEDPLQTAAQNLADFAWSAVTADCDESREYLQSLIDNLRAALLVTDKAGVERYREALEPFAAFRLNGFDGPVLEVCQPDADNPSPRIEILERKHFERARTVLNTPANKEGI